MRRPSASLALALPLLAVPAAGWSQQATPEGYEQILPRGAIAAIDDPQWVGAAEAEVPDDAWMLGVVIDGEARAFSINLLNAHEIVNDTIGGTPYAAVW